MNILWDDSSPKVHGECWIKGYEASDKMIFEDPNFPFCGVTSVIVRGDKLEGEGVLV